MRVHRMRRVIKEKHLSLAGSLITEVRAQADATDPAQQKTQGQLWPPLDDGNRPRLRARVEAESSEERLLSCFVPGLNLFWGVSRGLLVAQAALRSL